MNEQICYLRSLRQANFFWIRCGWMGSLERRVKCSRAGLSGTCKDGEERHLRNKSDEADQISPGTNKNNEAPVGGIMTKGRKWRLSKR